MASLLRMKEIAGSSLFVRASAAMPLHKPDTLGRPQRASPRYSPSL